MVNALYPAPVVPTFVNTLSTTLSLFDVAKASNNAQTAWDTFLPPYWLIRLPRLDDLEEELDMLEEQLIDDNQSGDDGDDGQSREGDDNDSDW